eukprot:12061582-Prorocentrum_lima.AAC.1
MGVARLSAWPVVKTCRRRPERACVRGSDSCDSSGPWPVGEPRPGGRLSTPLRKKQLIRGPTATTHASTHARKVVGRVGAW